MPREDEAAILDSARVHHSRLTQALERGSGTGRSRPVPVRMVASLVIAALACAGCVGYSFVSTHLDSIRQTRTSVPNAPVQPAQSAGPNRPPLRTSHPLSPPPRLRRSRQSRSLSLTMSPPPLQQAQSPPPQPRQVKTPDQHRIESDR